jgi:hypothetical protein
VLDAQYVQVAQKMIKEAKKSIQVMMFEMGYYSEHPKTASNQLIKELINARRRRPDDEKKPSNGKDLIGWRS